MKRSAFIIIASLLLPAGSLHAQYKGGVNDGISITLATGQNVSPSIYSGGQNDGIASISAIAQNTSPSIYSGGQNDGVALALAAAQNSAPSIYTGGINDGFSSLVAVSQNPSPSIYTGGINDGFSALSTAAQNPSPSIYHGGIDDGTALVSVAQQNVSPAIYSGGANDGWATITVTRQNSSNPLPVRLLAFTGHWQDEDALLTWNTAEEKGLGHYEIERSTDAVTFERIGNTPPKYAGTNEYLYIDFNAAGLPSGSVLYRLRMVGVDGKYTYSDVVRLTKDPAKATVILYPNPNAGAFTLLLDDRMQLDDVSYIIASASGQVVQQGRVLAAKTRYDISGLAPGVYIFSFLQHGQAVQNFKVFYNH